MGDVRQAADSAAQFATTLGFTAEHCSEIHLVVIELAANLLRHAAHGVIRIGSITAGDRSGIEIESEDEGPGIADVEQALTDGFSTAKGLGLGLGTINRLMDDLEITSGPVAGVRIVCRRWVRPNSPSSHGRELVVGVATRACQREPANGDAFIIRHWDRHALVGVIDGLGHGPLARRAAQVARQYIDRHFDQPLESIFRGADRACRATRGVVMALAHFDLRRHKFTVASIGNIEVRHIGGDERFNLIVRRGVVGLNAPNPHCTEHPWTDSSLLVMHSDGIHSRWDWRHFQEVAADTPDVIARRLLNDFGNPADDSTALVTRSAPK
jgi:anti-sigma regulatory factor (Ser/Thr protein kinase)